MGLSNTRTFPRFLDLSPEIRTKIYEEVILQDIADGYRPLVRDKREWAPSTAFDLSETSSRVKRELLHEVIRLDTIIFSINEYQTSAFHDYLPAFPFTHVRSFLDSLDPEDESRFMARPLTIRLMNWEPAQTIYFWTELEHELPEIKDVLLLVDFSHPTPDISGADLRHVLREDFEEGCRAPRLEDRLKKHLRKPALVNLCWYPEARRFTLEEGETQETQVTLVRVRKSYGVELEVSEEEEGAGSWS
ncbi:MAG: hypothetical protein M1821_007588 [Bathelium mastoideum]|nr:MAG: hypothetical protein M1821_007588 [Bathelium mastoideum]KAI9677946.1 MAG: hypothetical protein M1822_008054 [Bathelium mastoideum]